MRPNTLAYFMSLAVVAAQRATCARRRVGCVIVDDLNHIKATGYNGVASGRPHCIDSPCPGAKLLSGVGLDTCQALHAEQNALLQCSNVNAVTSVFVTASPCITCTKLLLGTSIQNVYFLEEYPHSDAKQMWLDAGRSWTKLDESTLGAEQFNWMNAIVSVLKESK